MPSKRQLKAKVYKAQFKAKAIKSDLGLAIYEMEMLRLANRSLKNENDALVDRLKVINAECDELRKAAIPVIEGHAKREEQLPIE